MHLLEKFNYCPACGSRHFIANSEKSRRCESCGFEYFMNASSANAAFILNTKGELLVTRRLKEPAKGTLDLPGGFADAGETAEQGVMREVKEETNLDVTRTEYLFSMPNQYCYSAIAIPTLDLFFLCEVADETLLKAADDAAECLWVPIDEIHTELFGLRSVRHGVRRFIESRR